MGLSRDAKDALEEHRRFLFWFWPVMRIKGALEECRNECLVLARVVKDALEERQDNCMVLTSIAKDALEERRRDFNLLLTRDAKGALEECRNDCSVFGSCCERRSGRVSELLLGLGLCCQRRSGRTSE